MDWVDGRPLQNLTMQMLWKILFLIFLEIGHRLGLADSPPTSPVCPDEPEDPEEEEPDDDNVLDEVGADTWEDHFRETVFSIFSDPENGSILKHRPIWIIRKILCV